MVVKELVFEELSSSSVDGWMLVGIVDNFCRCYFSGGRDAKIMLDAGT